jgi:hypothetical protein
VGKLVGDLGLSLDLSPEVRNHSLLAFDFELSLLEGLG